MLANFSIWPLEEAHMSADIAKVSEVLDRLKLRHQVGPMGTTVEGDPHEIIQAILACHEVVRERHSRVLTHILLDDSQGRQSMDESVQKVEQQTRARQSFVG